jgi:subtilisin family serine protease
MLPAPIGLVAVLFICGVAHAQQIPPPPASIKLYLKAGAFDPLRRTLAEALQAPDNLATVVIPNNPYYILQFSGPVRMEWKTRLMNAGVEFHDYVPDFAFLVKMGTDVLAVAKKDEHVRWIGPYEAACKVAPTAYASGSDVTTTAQRIPAGQRPSSGLVGNAAVSEITNEYFVVFFRGADVQVLTQEAKALGAEILGVNKGMNINKLRVRTAPQLIPSLARHPDVKWIEPATVARILNNVAASPNACGSKSVWDTHGLYGEGQVVAIADTGLDRGTNTAGALLHDDFEDGATPPGSRILAILDTAGDGNASDQNGHGTHVAGSILGNGQKSGGNPTNNDFPSTCFAGMAPKAACVMQALDLNGVLSTPSDLNSLFAVVTNYGAKIHSDSWSFPKSGFLKQTTVWWYEYTSQCQDVDEFMWNNKDFLVVFAAGNDGIDMNRDCRIDSGFDVTSPGQINIPGTAKNCLTVGASESLRLHGSGGSSGQTYGGMDPLRYPSEPISGDHLSDNLSGIAAFSSRGPTEDGRCKPDIVAPGCNILSVCSDSGTMARATINTNYTWSSGTSMATPLVAGSAALVREYFAEGNYPGITNPSAALVKAVLLNGATSLAPGQYCSGQTTSATQNATQEIPLSRPNSVSGWGRANIENSLYPPGGIQVFGTDTNANDALGTGETNSYSISLAAGSNVSVTLAWTDYPGSPGSGKQLVNDLDLEIVGPGGPYYPNAANTGVVWQTKVYDAGACGIHGDWLSSQDWRHMIWGETSWWSLPVEFAKRFTPSDYPATLEWIGAMIMVLDFPGTNAVVKIHDDDNTNGLPGTVLASTNILTGINSNPGIWHHVAVPHVTVTNGSVWVGICFNDQNRVGIWSDGFPMGYYGGAEYISQGANPPTNWIAGWAQYMIRAGFRYADAENTPFDRVNNVEGIDFVPPATSNYTIRVVGHNVPHGDPKFNNRQPFAVVVTRGHPNPTRTQAVFGF